MPRVNYIQAESAGSSGPISYDQVVGLSNFVNTNTSAAVATLVGAAPTTLDTLSEIADAIGDNAAFIDAVVLKSGSTMTGTLIAPTVSATNLSLGGVAITPTGAQINKLSTLTASSADLNVLTGTTAVASDITKIAGLTCSKVELNKLAGLTASTAELNKMAGVTASTAEINRLTGLTASTAEINKLAGVTASTAEINKLAGVTASTAEINRLTGSTFVTADLTKLGSLTATAIQLNKMATITASAAELNILTGCVATAADLNRLSGITPGTASASKVMITNSSNDISGINQLTANSWINTPTGLNSSSSLAINQTNDLILQKATVTYATLNDLGMALRSNAPYTIAHDTNGASQDLVIAKTGANTSRLRLYSDGTGTDGIIMTSSGGISLTGNTSINISATNGTIFTSGLQVSGFGISAATGIVIGAISTAGVMTIIDRNVSLINITSGSAGCVQVPYTGTLLNWQQVTLYNGTTNIIILGHKGSSSAGNLRCLWFELHPSRSVDILFDLANTCWILKQQPSNLFDFRLYRWSGDNVLNCFLNTNIGTYRALINVSTSTSTSINGVSTFQNMNTTTLTGTNWVFSNSAAMGFTSTVSGNFLTDTESAKFTGLIAGTGFSFTITFSNLTQGNYYQLCIYTLVWSATTTERSYRVVDNDTQKQITFNSELFTNNAVNAPGTINSYVFRQTNMTNRVFAFANINGAHIYGFTLVDLGSSL